MAAAHHTHLARVRAKEPEEAFEQTPGGPGMVSEKLIKFRPHAANAFEGFNYCLILPGKNSEVRSPEAGTPGAFAVTKYYIFKAQLPRTNIRREVENVTSAVTAGLAGVFCIQLGPGAGSAESEAPKNTVTSLAGTIPLLLPQ